MENACKYFTHRNYYYDYVSKISFFPNQGQPRKCDFLMLSAPTRLTIRKPTTLVIYLVMTFLVFSIEVLFVLPCKYTQLFNLIYLLSCEILPDLEMAQIWINLGFMFACQLFFLLSACI